MNPVQLQSGLLCVPFPRPHPVPGSFHHHGIISFSIQNLRSPLPPLGFLNLIAILNKSNPCLLMCKQCFLYLKLGCLSTKVFTGWVFANSDDINKCPKVEFVSKYYLFVIISISKLRNATRHTPHSTPRSKTSRYFVSVWGKKFKTIGMWFYGFSRWLNIFVTQAF